MGGLSDVFRYRCGEHGGESRSYLVHRITQNGKKIMDIVPRLRSIWYKTE